ncbi:MAG: metallophosphoesterase [Acidobacteriota bacterium]
MSETGRFIVFIVVALSIWAVFHIYVGWRLSALAAMAGPHGRRWLWAGLVVLWAAYPLGRILERRGLEGVGYPVELVGAVWMGALFLAFLFVLLTDLTLTWFLTPAAAPVARGIAAGAAILLTLIGVAQATRVPAVGEYEVRLAGLPPGLDGTVLVAISDLHLGSLLGSGWLRARVDQVDALKPDVIAVVGDLIDGNADRVERLVPEIRRLHAPLGVWAVTGNHEFYAGLDKSLRVFDDSGFRTVRDRWEEVAPGLIVAGVDDLTARRQFGLGGDHPVDKALGGRPAGATVFLCHTPWEAQRAASLGAGLMISGHTHDGQIWPFGYLVRLQYPFLTGLYEIGRMTLIVGRGTGTWGPPVRLWRRSEILRITLRSAPAQGD